MPLISPLIALMTQIFCDHNNFDKVIKISIFELQILAKKCSTIYGTKWKDSGSAFSQEWARNWEFPYQNSGCSSSTPHLRQRACSSSFISDWLLRFGSRICLSREDRAFAIFNQLQTFHLFFGIIIAMQKANSFATVITHHLPLITHHHGIP